MTVRITVSHNEARLAGTLAFLDAGSANAVLQLYGDARPSNIGDAPVGNLIAEIELTKPAGTISSNKLTLTAAEIGLVLVTGEVTWARIVNGDGVIALDADCSDMAGAGDVKLVATQLYAGGEARLATATVG